MKAKVSAFQQGDTIRFPTDNDIFEVTSAAPSEDIPGLIMLGLSGDRVIGTFGMAAEAEIEAVSMPRTIQVFCLLCKGTYPYDVDLVDGPTNPRGVCGPCDLKTTAEVLGARRERA